MHLSNLANSVVLETGLPEKPLTKELNKLVSSKGYNLDNLSIEQLRDVMVDYLNEVFLEIADNEKSA